MPFDLNIKKEEKIIILHISQGSLHADLIQVQSESFLLRVFTFSLEQFKSHFKRRTNTNKQNMHTGL